MLKRTREELQQMDKRTKKVITMHMVLHLRDNTDGLHVPRKEGGRGFTNIQDNVNASILRLKDYINKCRRRLVTAIRNNTDNPIIKRTEITRKQKWEVKQLYGHFKRQTYEISHEKTWT